MKRNPQSATSNHRIVSLLIIFFLLFIVNTTNAQPPCASSPSWCLTGNMGTSDLNFLGTYDSVPLIFRTNRIEWMRISPTGNVGVGTKNPLTIFHVAADKDASYDSSFVVTNTGNVGIGTTSPGYKLEVNGDVKLTGSCVLNRFFRTEEAGGMGNKAGISFGANAAKGAIYSASGITGIRIVAGPGGQSVDIGTNATNTLNHATFKSRLFVKSNGNIGIGTNAPVNKLDVQGEIAIGNGYAGVKIAPAEGVIIKGNVGIGTATPSEKLEVAGLIKLPPASQTQNDSPGLVFASDDDFLFAPAGKRLNHYGLGAYNNNGLKLYMSGFYGLDFFTGGQNRVTIDVNGGVGIGTSYIPASYKLAVEGKVIAEEFKIRLRANWPDYVFSKSYNILPLEKLEIFLINNNHLPGLPSANEVNANNGFNIGEIQVKHLERTEELFLYVIDLNKKIIALQKQNEDLQKQIIEIKK